MVTWPKQTSSRKQRGNKMGVQYKTETPYKSALSKILISTMLYLLTNVTYFTQTKQVNYGTKL